ncbi:MAG: hypothetical protein FWD53_06285 [Phycisphaerales bacterium]|nr:hypothetical protein [Phycisphaerales bacterium]
MKTTSLPHSLDAQRKRENGGLPSRIPRPRALIVLSGTLHQSNPLVALQCSLLDLPIAKGQSLLSLWHAQAAAFSGSPTFLRVVVSTEVPAPVSVPQVNIERDPSDFRGTGGTLADVCRNYDDSDWVWMANAAQIPIMPLQELWETCSETDGDVILWTNHKSEPVGFMLMRCECLKLISDIGYVDFKEQALPLIAKHHHIGVVTCRHPIVVPIRTRSEYLNALRHQHINEPQDEENVDTPNAFAEDYRSTFSIVEEGAAVPDGCDLHDSVILKGASVSKGAMVIRSIVGRGATVAAGERVIDSVRAGPPIVSGGGQG